VQKKGHKQNALILRPLLLANEEIRRYLGAVSLIRFFADKEMNIPFKPQSTQSYAEKRKAL
jgi:hypothetical protein